MSREVGQSDLGPILPTSIVSSSSGCKIYCVLEVLNFTTGNDYTVSVVLPLDFSERATAAIMMTVASVPTQSFSMTWNVARPDLASGFRPTVQPGLGVDFHVAAFTRDGGLWPVTVAVQGYESAEVVLSVVGIIGSNTESGLMTYELVP